MGGGLHKGRPWPHTALGACGPCWGAGALSPLTDPASPVCFLVAYPDTERVLGVIREWQEH